MRSILVASLLEDSESPVFIRVSESSFFLSKQKVIKKVIKKGAIGYWILIDLQIEKTYYFGYNDIYAYFNNVEYVWLYN